MYISRVYFRLAEYNLLLLYPVLLILLLVFQLRHNVQCASINYPLCKSVSVETLAWYLPKATRGQVTGFR